MSRFVTINYDPEKWHELKKSSYKNLVTITDGQSRTTNPKTNGIDLTPSKVVTFKFANRAKSREVSISPTKRVSSPVFAALRNLHKNGMNISKSRSSSPPVEFQRSETPNIEDSLTAMSMYQNFVLEQKCDQETLEADWLKDLERVAQRLHFLREAYRIVQSVHRKKLEIKESGIPQIERETADIVGAAVEDLGTGAEDLDVEIERHLVEREAEGDDAREEGGLGNFNISLLNTPSITQSPLALEGDQDEEDITSSQVDTSPIKTMGAAGGRNSAASGRRRILSPNAENAIYKNEENLDLDLSSLQENANDSIDGDNSSSNVETPMEHMGSLYSGP